MYIYKNENPKKKTVGDCVIRAISTVTDLSWNSTYLEITMLGLEMCDMPSSNHVWAEYLYRKGYDRQIIPNTCPMCYTIKQFCEDYPIGCYILATGTHVVAVIDGNYYDTWDSGEEVPIYYFRKEI